MWRVARDRKSCLSRSHQCVVVISCLVSLLCDRVAQVRLPAALSLYFNSPLFSFLFASLSPSRLLFLSFFLSFFLFFFFFSFLFVFARIFPFLFFVHTPLPTIVMRRTLRRFCKAPQSFAKFFQELVHREFPSLIE